MNADDVIESYVHDVARRLPRKRRDDVAFELRALLTEDLQHRASATGRAPDAGLALAMLRGFGRPGQTAARYHRPFAILEPSDTWTFVVAAAGGAVVLSILFAADSARSSVAVLSWLGLLVLLSALKNLILRRRPDALPWKPKRVRPVSDRAGRPAAAGFALAWIAAAVVYIAPGPIAEALTGGRVDAATLAYSSSFRDELRMPWLVGLIAAIVGLHVLVAIQGRWRGGARVTRIMLHASTAVQLGWHASYGDVFASADTDRIGITVIGLLSGALMVAAWFEIYRELTRVQPAPRNGMAT